MCVCVCVCVCVCASVQCMYRVHNGLPLHKKSYGTQCTCTCMYRRPFLYIPWTLHAAICTCTCTDQCAVEGRSIENHSYETHARRVAKGIQFHLHNVCPCIRVWESDLNAAQISSYKGSLMKSLPLLRDRMRGYMHWMAYC